MWSDVRGDVDPTIAAIGAVLLAFSVCALLLETVLNRQRTRPLVAATAGTGPGLGPGLGPGIGPGKSQGLGPGAAR
jgi:hypothetical protein